TDGVDDGIDTREPWDPVLRAYVAGEVATDRVGSCRSSAHANDSMACRAKRARQMAADEARNTGNQDDHDVDRAVAAGDIAARRRLSRHRGTAARPWRVLVHTFIHANYSRMS